EVHADFGSSFHLELIKTLAVLLRHSFSTPLLCSLAAAARYDRAAVLRVCNVSLAKNRTFIAGKCCRRSLTETVCDATIGTLIFLWRYYYETCDRKR
ncbi:MAG: hypothetical protein IKH12_06355, partial [Clostridia bacterium]|nr:hypothetical protein [Clostridia bacterium]